MSSSPPPASLPSREWCAHLARVSALASLLLTSPAHFGQASAARMPPASPSAPRAPGTLHQEILRLLESPESLPREADWAPLGPEALTELSGLASNPDAPEPRRTRAVAAMAVVSHPEASQRLQQLLRSSEAPPSLRAAATLALGRRAGLEAVPLLMPLLEDRNEQVRATAAQAVGRMGGPEARKVLEERLPLEENLEVREAIQRGLSYIEP
ncbi:HEAT repeat domain-containing protein [Archangium lipolyticum]|uniref:HEAT repeat domain-containing protein n=1 Tax=Archangium lipolyticum TaxID=2970465 RepID=UPI00214A434E|nr:HEAT repeat domain-containing protein [Archangium lipolyticum]